MTSRVSVHPVLISPDFTQIMKIKTVCWSMFWSTGVGGGVGLMFVEKQFETPVKVSSQLCVVFGTHLHNVLLST